MTNDQRRFGGQEYGAQQAYAPQQADDYGQPAMRPAPPYEPRPYAQAPAAQQVAAAPAYAPHVATSVPVSPAPSDPAVDGSVLVTLGGTYMAHDVTVHQVRFRKPTVRQLRKLGYPLRNVMVDGMPKGVDQVPEVCALYMTALSEPPLPMSTVDQFSLDDFTLCSNVITSFFL
ncbi:MAG: phage tail assembly protein [Hyphomicrobium sp.]|uniref:phage tail assembly protein n=1 Tax=Hyphomicrobium sp. TaxID=82 RepID=UPI003D1172EF